MYGIPNKYIAIVAAVLVAAFLILVWPVGLLMPDEAPAKSSSSLELPANITGSADFMGQVVPTSDTAYYVGGRWIAKPTATAPTAPVLPVTVSEVTAANQTAAENGADQLVPEPKPKTKGKTIEMSVFKDWVSDELTIQDSDISEFVVFADKTAVEDFVKGYSWNDKFNFQWNCDVLGIDIANDYSEADPAPAAFGTTGTSGNIYFVALSSDGITPDYFQLDSNKDSKPEVIEKKSGKKTVLAVDDWSTDAL